MSTYQLSPAQIDQCKFDPNKQIDCYCVVEVKGKIDQALLARNAAAATSNTESLRVVLTKLDIMDIPVQGVTDNHVELRIANGEKAGKEDIDVADSEAWQTFINASLNDAKNHFATSEQAWQISLYSISGTHHLLIGVFNSLTNDRYSVHNTFAQVLSPTAVSAEPDEEQLQFIDFSEWLNENRTDPDYRQDVLYWNAHRAERESSLKAIQQTEHTPASLQRTARFTLPIYITSTLNTQGEQLESLLLSAWLFTLAKVGAKADNKVFLTANNRLLEDLEGIQGFINQPVPFPLAINEQTSVASLLSSTTSTLSEHQQKALFYTHKASKHDVGCLPMFGFEFVNTFNTANTFAADSITLLDEQVSHMTSRLKLIAWQIDNQFSIQIEFDNDAVNAAFAHALQGVYVNALSICLGLNDNVDINTTINSISLFDAHTQQTQQQLFNESFKPQRIEHSIYQAIQTKFANRTSATALAQNQDSINFEKLETGTDIVIAHLKALGVNTGDTVAICGLRELNHLVAILALMKMGVAYVPLDPTYPQERLSFMLEDSQAKLLIISESIASVFDNTDEVAQCHLEALMHADNIHVEPHNVHVDASSTAYIMYTSGTTGKPKGTLISHKALTAQCLAAQQRYAVTEADRYFLSSPFSFDPSIEQLFTALISGATLVLKDDSAWSEASLTEMIREQALTVINVPTAFGKLLIEHWHRQSLMPTLPSVRLMISGGEQLLNSTVASWLAIKPAHAELLNAYGPTETVVTATVEQVSETTINRLGDVAIGRGMQNRQFAVVDSAGNAVPAYVIGELLIGGDSVADGYLNRPEQTAERFVNVQLAQNEEATRVYRTGDLVYFDATGKLFYCGRADQQIKFRGFRIEPDEIQQVLQNLPDVSDAFVALVAQSHTDSNSSETSNDHLLVAYWVPTLESTEQADIEAQIQQQLPKYMQPSFFIKLDALPVQANGKVDTNALKSFAFLQEHSGMDVGVQPQTPLEEKLLEVMQRLLRIDSLSMSDNFFTKGGHSLLAMRCLNQIRDEFKVEIPLKEFYKTENFIEVTHLLEYYIEQRDDNATGISKIARADRNAALPLSFAQERLLFIDHLVPNSVNYNMQAVYHFQGDVDIAAVQGAFQQLIDRHEILRTRFFIDNNACRQEILPHSELTWQHIALTAPYQSHLQTLIEADQQQAFDLANDNLLRVTCTTAEGSSVYLIITLHHIIADGWSTQLLIKEFSENYNRCVNGDTTAPEALAIQYVDFAKWQREQFAQEDFAKQTEYWTNELNGIAPVHSLPLDRPRTATSNYTGSAYHHKLPNCELAKINRFCQDNNLTLYMYLHATLSLALAKFSNQDDIVIGTPVNGRRNIDVEKLVGMFVNTLAIRLDTRSNQEVRVYLETVRNKVLDAFSNQDIPFEKVVEQINPERTLNYNPVVQILLVLQNLETSTLDLNGVSANKLSVDNTMTKFDLMVNAEETDDGLMLRWQYNASLFDEETIARMAQTFATLMQEMKVIHDGAISSVNFLSEQDKQWLSTQNYYQATPKIGNLAESFKLAASQYPDAIALDDGANRLTYRELDRASARVCKQLIDAGVQPQDRVGLHLQRSVKQVVGLLGILKMGAAYVPVDAIFPTDRIQSIFDDAQVTAVVCESAFNASEHTSNVVLIDELSELTNAAENDCAVHIASIAADSIAYLIYTSGTTGKPKGVQVSHHNVLSLIHSANMHYDFTAQDVWAQSHSIAFDVSVWEIWGALTHGATLAIPSADTVPNSQAMQHFILDNQVTVLSQTPSAFYGLIDAFVANDQTSALKYVVFGGEPLDFARLAPWQALAHQKHVALCNMYGITETTVHTTFYPVTFKEAAHQSVIGQALENSNVYLLDSNLQLVPAGAIGEICVSGDAVSAGYLNRDELNAEKFVTAEINGEALRVYRSNDLARWLPNGSMEYLGRRDEQVKVRGYRIELAEIKQNLLAEFAAAGLPLANCYVLKHTSSNNLDQLVTYLQPHSDSDISSDTLQAIKQRLAAKLPSYMLPQAYYQANDVRLTSNGKIDKSHLQQSAQRIEQQVSVAASTETEQQLLSLWSELLSTTRINVNDDFFKLGGHSLLIIQLRGLIANAFRVDLALSALFEHTSIQQQAQLIDAADQGIVPLFVENKPTQIPLTVEQELLWTTHQVSEVAQSLNNIIPVKLTGNISLQRLTQAFDLLQARHDVFRTTFPQNTAQEAYQHIADTATSCYMTQDLSAQTAEQQQASINALIHDELQYQFDLSNAPLMRVFLLTLSDEQVAVVINLHHILIDQWSVNLLLSELQKFYQYGSSAEVSTLPAQLADVALWQAEQSSQDRHKQSLSFWQDYLRNAPQQTAIANDAITQKVAAGSEGKTFDVKLSTELTQQLRDYSQAHDTSTFVLLFSAFNLMLHYHLKQSDLVVGTDAANREHPDMHGIIGFFVNQLAIRNQVDSSQSLAEFVAQVKASAINAISHQQVPFQHVVKALDMTRQQSDSPLFQTKFYIDKPLAKDALASTANSFAVERIAQKEKSARLAFTMGLVEDAQHIHGQIVFDKNRYKPSTVKHLASQFEQIVATLMADASQAIATLGNTLTAAETSQKSQQKMSAAQAKLAAFGAAFDAKPTEKKTTPSKKMEASSVSVSTLGAVTTYALSPVTPASHGENSAGIFALDRTAIMQALASNGAVLLRGYNITQADTFQRIANHFIDELVKENPEHNNVEGTFGVQTPIAYAKQNFLLWHNENTFNPTWPTKVAFCSAQPAEQGGDMHLVDTHKLLNSLSAPLRTVFETHGVMYVRVLEKENGIGLGWTTIFGTEDKADVEAQCHAQQLAFEWQADDVLVTKAVRPALFSENPEQGAATNADASWVAQILHWHPACLDPKNRAALLNLSASNQLPRDCRFGDGSEISDSVINEIMTLHRKLDQVIAWKQGDVLLINNGRVAHARAAYQGERKHFAAFGDLVSFSDAQV